MQNARDSRAFFLLAMGAGDAPGRAVLDALPRGTGTDARHGRRSTQRVEAVQ